VLFISGCPGGSRKYRCENLAEALEKRGLRSLIVSQSNPFIRQYPCTYRIYILQRVSVDDRARSLIDDLRRSPEKSVVFETDDLVFDPQYLRYVDILPTLPEAERQRYIHGIGKELLTDAAVESCSVSTPFLRQIVERDYPGKRVFVLRNRLAHDQLASADRAFRDRFALRIGDGRLRVGYFSGSPSHDRDFASIADVLLDMLRTHREAVLVIVGYLVLDPRFHELKGQIERHPFVALGDLPSLVVQCDINIAPLEMDNPFCRAKSELKFFEAGILEVPTIASSTDSFRDAIRHGENGFLAADSDEWREGLERLLANPELRMRLGRQAKRDTLARYTTASPDPDMDAFVEFLNGKTEGSSAGLVVPGVQAGQTGRR
jgi:glycosyltransferase involved in cell wall biosynthesis